MLIAVTLGMSQKTNYFWGQQNYFWDHPEK